MTGLVGKVSAWLFVGVSVTGAVEADIVQDP